MARRVYLTGGTGQIGSQVARALVERGDEVTALVRDRAALKVLDPSGLRLVEGDVTEPSSLRLEGHDAVVHCAGVVSFLASKADWQRRVNVEGTRNVLDAAAAAGCRRLVLTSSIAALGWVDGEGLGDEQTPYNWSGMGLGYQDSKKEAQDLVLSEARLETVAVNPGIVFGSHDVNQNGGRVLLTLAGGMKAVPSGRTTAVNLSDVVEGHLAALERGRPGHAYVLAGFQGSFLELYARAAEVMGVAAPTRVAPDALLRLFGGIQVLKARFAGGEPSLTPALATVSTRNRQYSGEKARAELGIEPTDLDDGIRSCLAWYREQGLIR